MSLWGKLQRIGFLQNMIWKTDSKALFRDSGIFIYSQANGKLTISSDGTGTDDITLTGSQTCTGDQVVTGDVTLTGDQTITGDLLGTGDITRTGDITLTGALSVSGAVTQGGVVSATDSTLALTQALHAGKIVTADRAAGVAFTLPEATGTGDKYTVVLGTAMTSNSLTVTAADTTNADYAGSILMVDLDAATTAYIAQTIQATGDDIFTMNRTTTGGVNVGADWVTFTDIKTDLWLVDGVLYVPTGSNPATPFSGT